MKKMIKINLLLFFIIIFFGNQVINAKDYPNEYVSIKYKLKNYSIIASNQMAIWIKDLKGNYITTIYATKFMARGGYKEREDCCPIWRSEVNWENASKKEIDSVSAATQKSGIQEVLWNCRDKNGSLVKAGTYIYQIEVNIYYDERILFIGKIEIGGNKNSSKPEIKYYHTKYSDKKKKVDKALKKYGNIIESVEVSYTPK